MTERTPFVISTEKGCKPAEWRNLARLRIGRQTFFRRVLPYFTVQDKIPRLTLGMTGMGANILYCIHNFTFYILHSTFQKRSFGYAGIVVPAPLRMTEREKGCSASFSVTLSSSSHAYAVSILPMAKCSTCKAAPPLPKNLAALRFSGALFYELRSRMGLFFHKGKSIPPPTKKTGGAPAFSKILFKKRGNVRLLRLGLLRAHDE